MVRKSAKQYIIEDDFEGAFERFETTTKQWKNYWFEVCQQIANNCQEFLQRYIINPIDKTIQVIRREKKQKKSIYDNKIIIDCKDLMDNKNEKCYLFEFYNSKNNLVCSKVGTTKRKVLQRLKEELNSDTYKKLDCAKAIIRRVYDCGDMPAEGAESFLRAFYIKKYPNSFKKNDRFMKEFFDFEITDKLMEKYLEIGLTIC